ncbi:MAG: FG-GAP repeat protein [Armatimonadetes bacterium]|nr:FG-GAP repeat protein [Anaerolineae bacterium]
MPSRRITIIVGSMLLIAVATLSTIGAQQLHPLPASNARAITELLTNTSFETDTDDNNIPDGWTGKNTDAVSADKQKCDKVDKLVAHIGNCAFQFKGNADGSSSNLTQTVVDTSAIINGATVTFSAFIDPRSGVVDAVFGKAQLKYSDGSKQKFELVIPDSVGREVADYVLIEDMQTVVIPAGAMLSKAKAKFTVNQVDGKFLVDDVSFAVGTVDLTPTPTAISATATWTVTTTVTSTPSITPTPGPTLPVTKLVADDGENDDNFGKVVAYSSDGNTLLIGAYVDNIGTNDNQGSAYIFVREGTTWVQQAKLIADDGVSYGQFGLSVALSANGDIALVGAGSDNQYAVYVFLRSGTTWTQQTKLTADSAANVNNGFGTSVALNATGDTALIGASGEDINASYQGAAYVFVRSGTTWTQQAKLTDLYWGYEEFFGRAVALTQNGNLALIGASGDGSEGVAHIFTRSGTTWTQQPQALTSDTYTAIEGGFGDNVALNAEGTTALIGHSGERNGTDLMQGSAYVFVFNGTIWEQQAKFLVPNIPGHFFGRVALSFSGDVALVGMFEFINPIPPPPDFGLGAAYVYVRSGSTWMEQIKLTADDGVIYDRFGSAVALSSDGSTALLGANGYDISRGSAYLFALP